MSKSREYRSWSHMIGRCRNPTDDRYRYYGARGIKVCDRWSLFENFFEDMGPSPPGHSIDRIDNDGDYEPANCRWSDQKRQTRNRRTNRVIEHAGEKVTLAEWSEKTGIKPATIARRIDVVGWSAGDALANPVLPGGKPGRFLELDGEVMRLSDWSRRLGIPYGRLHARVKMGWSDKDVLTRPLFCPGNRKGGS